MQVLTLLPELPAEVRYILGDQHDNDPTIDAACAAAGWTVVATRRGPYPHTDAGVGVRRILHELRSRAIENLNEQFKGIFDAHGQVPTKGLLNTRRFALSAVFVYQLMLWYRHEHGLDLRIGLKPFLKAAQSFMTRPQLVTTARCKRGFMPHREQGDHGKLCRIKRPNPWRRSADTLRE